MLGIGDFFTSIMTPLHAAISAVLVFAYRMWSYVTGADTGVTWALAIIFLTIIVRTLLIPLFVKQINSARNMQLIQPKMKALQDKYGADRERLGIETQKLMKEEGVNPWASCFPMLIQMPIFFALYQVLYGASQGTARGYYLVRSPELVESLRVSKFLGAELSGHFWMSDWSGFGATQIMAVVLILAMSALFFITQRQLMSKNMPPSAQEGPAAQQQKMMLYVFPVMYLFMGMMIPVGVLVYWVASNTWTLVQQFILIRNNPTPGTPAYLDWEERMRAKGLDPKEVEAKKRAKKSKAGKSTQSRTVGGTGRAVAGSNGDSSGSQGGSGSDKGSGSGGSPSSGGSGVERQQIQRQQPARNSRAARSVPKNKNGKDSQ
jgi:YidC/Oxa1 family membrane protein insertase